MTESKSYCNLFLWPPLTSFSSYIPHLLISQPDIKSLLALQLFPFDCISCELANPSTPALIQPLVLINSRGTQLQPLSLSHYFPISNQLQDLATNKGSNFTSETTKVKILKFKKTKEETICVQYVCICNPSVIRPWFFCSNKHCSSWYSNMYWKLIFECKSLGKYEAIGNRIFLTLSTDSTFAKIKSPWWRCCVC